ncbi:Woronin body major protein [Cladobotryum mycophilum]|uniref:Woronin body major protein n=1 Tax=Cladobotryum mycophilum TaxID=491253 RepID=A0ABR0SGR0_9HYPO
MFLFHDLSLRLYTQAANLDFEARVPVPFSIFPSTYKDTESKTATTTIHKEVEIKLPEQQAGREGQHSSFSVTTDLPHRGEQRIEEEVRITREEEHYRRPGVHSETFVKEEYRPAPRAEHPLSEFTNTRIEVDSTRNPYVSPIDVAERQYREHYGPQYNSAVDVAAPTVFQPRYHSDKVQVNDFTTVSTQASRPSFREEVKVTKNTVETTRVSPSKKPKMGYYDDAGHYHQHGSIRNAAHKLADRVSHHGHNDHVDVNIRENITITGPSSAPLLDTWPTLSASHATTSVLVIRISTSSATGQYRYLGVDLFTKQLHEESSNISNPAPSVIVQSMLGPVFKQYRVLDMGSGTITAMTESGDVKPDLPVIEQSDLWRRLKGAFESGRGSVRVLVLNDGGRELAVDLKVIHGSRL